MGSDLKQLSEVEFPQRLREIPQPPKQLLFRGTVPPFDYKWLAVVGSRSCTSYGRQCVSHLISGLRGHPLVIVSGLAYGIDAEAHKAALDAGLTTVAVPGSGLDWNVLYPRAHVSLAREIIDSGGALLSEFKADQKAADYTFPQRNRIMVGLSHAVLVVEAKERSGTLITARLATEYNRELLVVPGSIFSDESRGAHQFLKLGASPVTGPNDILTSLNLDSSPPVNADRSDVSPDEFRVLDILIKPLERDDLIIALSMSATDANVLLSMMEIKGLIVEEFGQIRRK